MRRLSGLISSGIVVIMLLSFAQPTGPTDQVRPNEQRPDEQKPNIIFVLTDDQDAESLGVMPNVNRYLVQKGKIFRNAIFTQPLCCPSRASMLRGQYPHNTGVLDILPPDGGHRRFKSLGRDRSTYATWLSAAGYRTGYFGKYLNGYEDPAYVPPGWDRWVVAEHAPATMRVSDNGRAVKLRGHYGTFDLAMKDYSVEFLKNRVDSPHPFLMTVSFSASHVEHGRAKYEKKYARRFSNREVPKPPNFNEKDRSDKPEWVRQLPSITPKMEKKLDTHHRARLRSLLTVDDAVEEYVKVLWKEGELDNTYIFYFTDNGYHMGNHALPDIAGGTGGKSSPYTEDVEFPLIIRGPGINPGTKEDNLVANTDLAPTFADVAGASPRSSVDGRSLLPLMRGLEVPWRDALLVEGKNDKPWPEPEGWMASYKQVRTKTHAYHYYPDTGEEELYDFEKDSYQLQSVHEDPAYKEVKTALRSRLEELENCAGAGCRRAENGRYHLKTGTPVDNGRR